MSAARERRAGAHPRTRRLLVTMALVMAALACSPGSAGAWQLTTQMYGGGTVKETTNRNLYGSAGCTSSSAVASGAFSGNCVAGTPDGVYNSADIVRIEASVPPAYAAEGWQFAYWVSNDGSGRVDCDGTEDAQHHNTLSACQFQIFQNLSMGAVFVDNGTPDTNAISGTPAESSRTSVAQGAWGFSSPDPTAALQCSFDGVNWSGCVSNPTLSEGGPQTLRARAVDPTGHADGSPATRTFIIDRTPPDTALNSQPPSLTNSAAAHFAFGSSFAGGPSPEAFNGFGCRLDDAPDFTSCPSGSVDYAGLGEGQHTFRVRAQDTAGNVDATPATYSWTVDTVAPDTAITAGPPATTKDTSAKFTFFSEAGATFLCSLDSAGFASCPTDYTLSGLGVGRHTMRVKARDAAGNDDATPASRTWTIEGRTTPPTVTPTPTPSATPTPTVTPPAPVIVNATLSTDRTAFAAYTIFRRLTLKGVPRGATVTVNCKGKKCPSKRFTSKRSGAVKLKKFTKKKLRVGTKLTIRVTKDGAIGKQFVIKIRKAKAPAIKITQIA
jgi:hypothetical protein